MPAILVITTVPDAKTAKRLAAQIVKNRLAACVSTLRGVHSYYSWKGTTEESSEILLLIKTVRGNFKKLSRWIRSNHPYELPEIAGIPIACGSSEYLSWLAEHSR